MFYPKLAAFNINWYSGSSDGVTSAQVPNPHSGKKGVLTRKGWDNYGQDHSSIYSKWFEEIRRDC
jgi:hypothetical protein